MKFSTPPSKTVPFYAHPTLVILVSTIGLISGILAVYTVRLASQLSSLPLGDLGWLGRLFEIVWSPRAPWVSFAVGIAVGLVIISVQKRLLRSHILFYADFFTMPLLERLRWDVLSTNLTACLPTVVGPLVAAGVACALQISPWPAFFGPSICSFLVYPEQKLIYEATKSRLVSQEA